MRGDRSTDCLKNEIIETDCLGNDIQDEERLIDVVQKSAVMAVPLWDKQSIFEAFQRRCLLVALLCNSTA